MDAKQRRKVYEERRLEFLKLFKERLEAKAEMRRQLIDVYKKEDKLLAQNIYKMRLKKRLFWPPLKRKSDKLNQVQLFEKGKKQQNIPLVNNQEDHEAPKKSAKKRKSPEVDSESDFEEVKKGTQKTGQLVIIDFFKTEVPVGPSVDHKISMDQVVAELKEAGYSRFEVNVDLLPYQYIIRAK